MLNDLHTNVHAEMDMVLSIIENSTTSEVPLIKKLQSYVLKQPEKKLIRPLITLLLANACQYQGKHHITLAAIIEMIHGATLLHDDIIDKACTRRNKLATHLQYGTNQSILMGDFIYACAFKLIAQMNNPKITSIVAQTTKEIVEGEVLQLSLQGQVTTLDQYMHIIKSKTALLFITSAQCIESLSKAENLKLADYAFHFGMLYQITDDILDVDTSNTLLNKAHGTDLKEGKMTLPTLIAYQQSTEKDKKTIQNILNQETPWEEITPIFQRTDAIKKCKPYLDYHIQLGTEALISLPHSVYKSKLIQILSHIPHRKK